MVRPALFYPNPDTHLSNSFQASPVNQCHYLKLTYKAQCEFDRVVKSLRQLGIEVSVFRDTASPDKPDAIFANDWLSTHQNGKVVIYPMRAKQRRSERAIYPQIHRQLAENYTISALLNISDQEQQQRYLEGPGALCIDHLNNQAYVGLSNRTDRQLVEQTCNRLGLTPIIFNTEDNQGNAVYHTNLMLCINTEFALLGSDMIPDQHQRQTVINALKHTGREVITLSNWQVGEFAANAIELTAQDSQRYLLMSQRGRDSLSQTQLAKIAKFSQIVSVELPTIELSGASIGCMIAGIYLPFSNRATGRAAAGQ